MYVDAILDKDNEIVKIVERVNGNRVFKDFPIENYFYVNDPKGNFKTIFGNSVKKIEPKTSQEKAKLINIYGQTKTWESDVNPILRSLENNYLGKGSPKLNIAFFDIETSFDEELGYSTPEDATNPILSIAVHLQWLGQTVCLAVPPKTITEQQAQDMAKEVGSTYLCKNEKELLSIFLDLIEDADVLSGWYSSSFDIVYTTNRIIKVLGSHETRRMCLWDKKPKKKNMVIGGREEYTYELIGRIHVDYMVLYKKYSYEERQSYSLDSISELELDEKKVPYDGTLDQLYKKDFKKFLEYNIQDTMLLDKLDKKLKYIDLVNTIAHENVVRIQDTSGTVITTEQAILKEAHSLGLIVPDRRSKNSLDSDDEDEEHRAAGGWVSKPKSGLHKWIGSTDMNSLYPSVIRALNMSPETIIGQIRTDRTDRHLSEYLAQGPKYNFSTFWNDKFNTEEMEYFYSNDKSEKLYLDMESGETLEVTGAEVRNLIFNDGRTWCISANGTIFDFSKQGIIPKVLEKWYIERKAMQNIESSYIAIFDTNGIEIDPSLFSENDYDNNIPESNGYVFKDAFNSKILIAAIQNKDTVLIKRIINEHKLLVKNGKIVSANQVKAKDLNEYWAKQQLVRKILLNSVYGGLLNEYHRFFDQRVGQSTTLTGRSITRHMASMTNKVFTGSYDYTGDTIIYGDTDSCYFTVYPVLKDQIIKGEISWDKDKAIELYNEVASVVCDSFPGFANDTFNIPLANGAVLRSSRETVSSSGLFVKKKRYALMMFDKDGKRQDVKGKPGKLKVTGLDLRRSDTPKKVSEFLSNILMDLLLDKDQEYIVDKIREFKKHFVSLKPWEKGVPKAVNNLTTYREKIENYQLKRKRDPSILKPSVPGHVSASIYWNMLRDINDDKHSIKILDGSKIVVCNLKETATNSNKSIAYPIDEDHLPEWFLELPFDEESMLDTVVNSKLENLLGVLNWDLSMTDPRGALMQKLFDFSAIKKA